MNIIKYRNIFFAISLLIIIPGIYALSVWGLRLGIDFAGGTLWEIKFTDAQEQSKPISAAEVKNLISELGTEVSSTANTSEQSVIVRMKASDEVKISEVRNKLKESYGEVEDARLETVGPVISKELTKKAATAVGISILAIVTYVTWAFRKVAKPASPLAFGVCTIVALVHDVIVVVGVFAILGHFFGIEVDSLFITALLTVIGFSVHDTIVVFDRIRENLRKYDDFSLEEVVNHSINQTLARSLNTSLTVLFVLLALYLFGGESTKTFILALLIGVISGTYSSIFNASPLLVVWNKQVARPKKS
ncbi:MAG: protein translocase subunit SecF [Candidatus Curtissbacteria bacterium]|nr:protein translocase subunit SecF [Candidatus Curtissbacteria bacterium]